jgi:molybdenum cofactor synthesis domain-containing protein
MPELTAAAVVIGNEILSGKVVDTNSPFLAAELRELGVALRRITIVPDALDEIATEVRSAHRTFDVVFTSGGVGPTHDDITMEGIARGLERRVVVHPDI